MTSLLAGLVACIAVPTAICFTPWLTVRLLLPRAPRDVALATTGLAAFILNLLLPCLMHGTGIPIQQSSLALLHFALLFLSALSMRLLRRKAIPAGYHPAPLQPWLILLLMAILVFPFTYMAGIDTYKWQDMATNMAVEQNVPWLVHPLSLAGFTPRSYPSLHPLMQGSLAILGATGVDGGFWLTSLVIAWTGIFAANLLASAFTSNPARQAGYAAMYVLAPVFMRYVHWGTGRGVYLALLPLFVWGLLKIRRPSGLLMTLVSGLCLVLAHKAGIPTLMVLFPAMAIGLLLPTRWSWTAPVLLGLALVLGVLMSPRWGLPGLPGHLLGYVSRDVRRLGWMGIATVLGILLYPRLWNKSGSTRACLGGLLASLPLAHHSEMYGAMLTLPFVCIAAWCAVLQLVSDWPRHRTAILKTVALLTIAGGLAIVVQRSVQATPARVYKAAMFIEHINPRGPFRIISSRRHGIHIQGYVSGCPRFSLQVADPRAFNVNPPPFDAKGPLRRRASVWIAYLRGFLNPPGIATDWYGGARTIYHVILDNERKPPSGSVLIYDEDGVKIFDQTAP
ncbi:MAG: hypothetical protein QGH42_00560 [Kiritimatiellia bacterium]|jgi:hypothetical protein|nr:hypothetical protein [Candidatus Brocadiia bacterium]MDP6630968.1 hypothetical protein [Kiritimatiellia bacterium]MDP6810283.1 hypothetical protein [Kiritimatiellia bacterium]MDP7022728.1 hypothetical protein [Kiritimatiellia bacterium]